MKRKASLDLLRIICMIGVVIEHIFTHGGVLSQCPIGSGSYWLFMPIDTIFGVSVNCFVLLSGYNLVDCKFSILRLIKIWTQVFMFSTLCLLLRFTILNVGDALVSEEILKCFIPIISRRYWYMTLYFLLVIFAPYFNLLCDRMTQKEYINLLFIFGILSSVATIFYWSQTTLGTGYDFLWFTVLYFIGGYFKRYGAKKSMVKLSIIWIVTVSASVVVRYIQGMEGLKEHVTNYNSLFMVVPAVCVFLLFLNMDIKSSFWVKLSGFGKYVLGAYLISDHPIIRKQLWEYVNLSGYAGIEETVLHCGYVIISTITVGTCVEFIRSKLIRIAITKR